MNIDVIVGSTHGIGFAAVCRLLESGRTVIGCASSMLDPRGAELEAKYPCYRHYFVDVSDEEAVKDFFSAVSSLGYSVRMLLNCAGVGFARRDSKDLCSSDAERVLKVNTLGTAYILKYGQKVMCSDGVFMVCGSIASCVTGTGADAVYGASKAAIKPLLMNAAVEEDNTSRAFVYLNLGYIETRMTCNDDKQVWVRITPYAQVGTPQETADFVIHIVENCKPGYSEAEMIGGGYPVPYSRSKRHKVRSAGVQLMINSLPNKYGCGSFGSEAFRMIDELCASGLTHILLLPFNQTGFMNSPYSALSSISGSINLISPEFLYADGLLSSHEHAALLNFSEFTDYESCCLNRPVMLKQAHKHFKARGDSEELKHFGAFCEANKEWLDDFAVFMSAKYKYGRLQWQKWPDKKLRAHNLDAVERYVHENQDDVEAWKFSQFIFYEQFAAFRNYANENGIDIIGDIPFYVCADSSDVWGHRDLFSVDPNTGEIVEAGGIPNRNAPDTNWGVPVHMWDVQKADGFKWWRKRIRFFAGIMDGLRIDHSLGMLRYYAIPSDGSTPLWRDGPDVPDGAFSRMIAYEAARYDTDVIAEDLGQIPQGLRERIDELGFCGTRIIQYAFSNKYFAHSHHLPMMLSENRMIFTGTHDNPPLREFLRGKTDSELAYMMYMLNTRDRRSLHWLLIRAAYESAARYCTIPVQDFLELGMEACLVNRRDFGMSWLWRMKNFTRFHSLNRRLRAISILSGRIQSTEEESFEALEYILGGEEQ